MSKKKAEEKPQEVAVVAAPEGAEEGMQRAKEAFALVKTINSLSDLQEAKNLLDDLTKRDKEIKEFFKPMKQAASAAHKAIVAREKEFLEPIDEMSTAIRREMGAFNLREERRIAEEKAVNKGFDDLFGPSDEEPEVRDEPAPVATVSGLSFKKKFTFTVVDIEKIPERFKKLVADEEKIQKVVDAMGFGASELIDGIKIELEKKAINRSAK